MSKIIKRVSDSCKSASVALPSDSACFSTARYLKLLCASASEADNYVLRSIENDKNFQTNSSDDVSKHQSNKLTLDPSSCETNTYM